MSDVDASWCLKTLMKKHGVAIVPVEKRQPLIDRKLNCPCGPSMSVAITIVGYNDGSFKGASIKPSRTWRYMAQKHARISEKKTSPKSQLFLKSFSQESRIYRATNVFLNTFCKIIGIEAASTFGNIMNRPESLVLPSGWRLLPLSTCRLHSLHKIADWPWFLVERGGTKSYRHGEYMAGNCQPAATCSSEKKWWTTLVLCCHSNSI